MKRIFLLAALASFATPFGSAAEPQEPVSVAYFYTVKWGYQQEFLDLFAKNHYPVLKEQVKSGRILDIKTYEPTFHGDGRADWTFMVVLTFKNWQVLSDASEEAAIKLRLYPDQATFIKEEQRRFEILEEHWDVPLKKAVMER
jgi:hypothetical protein